MEDLICFPQKLSRICFALCGLLFLLQLGHKGCFARANSIAGPYMGIGVNYARDNVGWEGDHIYYSDTLNQNIALSHGKDPANKVIEFASGSLIMGYLMNISDTFYTGLDVTLDFLQHKGALRDIHTYSVYWNFLNTRITERYQVEHKWRRTFLGAISGILGYMANNCLSFYAKFGVVMGHYRTQTVIENLDDASNHVSYAMVRKKTLWGARPAFGWLFRLDQNWSFGGEMSWDLMRSWTVPNRDNEPNLTYKVKFRPNNFAAALRLIYHIPQ